MSPSTPFFFNNTRTSAEFAFALAVSRNVRAHRAQTPSERQRNSSSIYCDQMPLQRAYFFLHVPPARCGRALFRNRCTQNAAQLARISSDRWAFPFCSENSKKAVVKLLYTAGGWSNAHNAFGNCASGSHLIARADIQTITYLPANITRAQRGVLGTIGTHAPHALASSM